ncbi:hypothetical protein LEP1GSC040_0811 [Leptospira santarosai str. 2000030832]|nr:hypothetical protein LEP1GSC040_0811 [Leptospira santarosai str. 2000030832]
MFLRKSDHRSETQVIFGTGSDLCLKWRFRPFSGIFKITCKFQIDRFFEILLYVRYKGREKNLRTNRFFRLVSSIRFTMGMIHTSDFAVDSNELRPS